MMPVCNLSSRILSKDKLIFRHFSGLLAQESIFSSVDKRLDDSV